MIAYWTIRPRLLRVPGRRQRRHLGRAAQDAPGAGRPGADGQHDVTSTRCMEATSDALDVGLLQFSDGARIGTGGFVDTANQRLQRRASPPIVVTPEDLAKVPVDRTGRDGKPLIARATWPISSTRPPGR